MKFTLPTLVTAWGLVASSAANTPLTVNKTPVDVTLFVMSRCPDAMKCEYVFSQVFQTENLPPVKPLLSYIGSIHRTTIATPSSPHADAATGALTFTTSTTTTTSVTCKHGPLECAGNIQQLCFKKYFPDHKVWVPFVVTMNSLQPTRIGDPKYAREVAEKVLGSITKEEGKSEVPLDQVDECAKGEEGFELLVESVQYTIDHGIGTSCTMFIDNKKRCVVDGGFWRDCPEGSMVSDFVRSIQEAASRFTSRLVQSRLLRWSSS
ncbi:hypothetical protein EDD21DRAFT_374369 [Dissophora ornata]|nr:hypothetical protein BGZ58_008697 [Dissophora ornata]KAI8601479.1 hypothetical protein EDD21DRAFT_374369 [Dissophora ornata]